MEKEQEKLQFVGFFGIWRESFKIISTWNKIFIRLGLTLILPLSFIYLAHTEIDHLLLQNISQTMLKILEIADGDTQSYEKSLRTLLGELAVFILSQVAFIVFLLIFSLLSTSAIVYTVACIYLGKSVTFKEVMCAVPKVWKRLMVTFLCVMAIIFLYNFVFIVIAIFIFLAYPLNFNNLNKISLIGVVTLFVVYVVGLCYMSVIWQLANTISILEESYGFQALKKSKILMKGKMGVSVSIFLSSNICVGVALGIYNSCVVSIDQSNSGILSKVGFGVFTLFLLCIVNLAVLVVQTVFYLVCKSFHHELIDKNALSDHLEIYQGEGFALLKSKDSLVLMEHV